MDYIFQGPRYISSVDLKPYMGRRLGIESRVVEDDQPTRYLGFLGIPQCVEGGIAVVDNKSLSCPQVIDLSKTFFDLRFNQRIYLE